MASPVIVVEDLYEEFKTVEDRARSFKEALSRFKIVRGRSSQWALRGVSLTVGPGESVGLIGENGSGKSTLLRCIAGILPPTKGSVLVGGTVSSLIELGAGFHPDLTGRENAFVTAALFGIRRSDLVTRFDEIVSFSELEDVIDHPVRSYSTGMYVRLAFSIAIHVEPDILLIDEVLAVGDESFQRRCIARIGALASSGVAILFVSHDLELVRRVCKRSVLLHKGIIIDEGSTESVVESYLERQDLRAGGPSRERR